MPVVKNAFDRQQVQKSFIHDDDNPETWDRVKQEFKDDCDVNKIVERFRKTGVMDHLRAYGGSYNDVTPNDLQTAINQANAAQSMFDDLPSHVRARCDNNPVNFLEFVQNPQNQAELVELGLAVPPAGPVVPDPTTQPAGLRESPSPGEGEAAPAAEGPSAEGAPPSST